VRTGAETIGLGMSLGSEFLPSEDGPRRRAALAEPLLKLLAIVGYRQPGGKPFPSLLLSLDGKENEYFNLKDPLASPTSFAVPDQFVANTTFLMERKQAARNAGIAGQAELLRGI